MDSQETRRAVAAIAVVGQIDGHDVIRRSSALDVVQRREVELQAVIDALWKACGDDQQMVNELIESQRMPDTSMCPHEHAVTDWRLHRSGA
jgi:hypothetical protein